MPTNVDIPALGESVTEAVLIKWLKKEGDFVNAQESLCELETDKANVDLPAPASGVLRRVKEEGDTVHIGDTVARIDENANAAAPAPTPARSKEAVVRTPPPPSKEPVVDAAKEPSGSVKPEDLSPAVRRVVTEKKLDPAKIPGTGPGGRILKDDAVKASQGNGANSDDHETDDHEVEVSPALPTKPAMVKAPAVQSKSPAVEKMSFDADGTKRVPMTKIRKRIAENLVRAQQTAAILTTFNEVDLTEIIELRNRFKQRFQDVHGVSLGFMSFFCRAVVLALREFPRVNASLEGDTIIFHDYVHLGIAVSTDRGLAVPVMRNAHRCSFAQVESEIKRLANSTRDGHLSLEELTGGTFTITNGGVFGSLLSTPIINPPQAAILGMHTIQKRAMVLNDKVEIRSMMYIALSYDHRLIDGKESVSFLARVKEFLESPARLMLEI